MNHKIAELYEANYNVPITVIRNIPKSYKYEKTDSFSIFDKDQKFIIYQGSLNLGRGLELMIDSMSHLKGCKLLICGDGDISIKLK